MDSDFWTARLAAAKRQFTMQHHHHQTSHLDRFNVEDVEVEEEIRPDFPCPYCYEDFDIGSLCSHLEDEHSCESKAAICPVCSVKVTRDMLSHITLQHGHLFKSQRRRRLRRVAVPNSQALSLLGRDLREAHLQVLLSGGYRSSNTATSSSSSAAAAAADPFLSSLVLNFPGSETEEISKSNPHVKNSTPQHIWKASFDPSLSCEEREKRMRQARGRAVFLQDLLVSTLLGD
ncbi:putative drought induced 19 type, zinc-binding protein [Helianthus annuus]|nr:putative drought induced 19 type, zinc-binding protein [Helianthus annuus]KAJ0510433.1 putative drought induced 19 type, zinc-binding protein [Helianthus annuus]KAJ0518318.1 putative drought induced 19 type, zinc-binding protein [Helianthus annuus]KAJ0686351.1 putative drought induced 19 type, zinc-binding protein [Helianthus annuus]KAJ0690173.1 putative drought induced 19 type, zinc-binding protein [Helianthus annuus]